LAIRVSIPAVIGSAVAAQIAGRAERTFASAEGVAGSELRVAGFKLRKSGFKLRLAELELRKSGSEQGL
jgi:hypothetical protein